MGTEGMGVPRSQKAGVSGRLPGQAEAGSLKWWYDIQTLDGGL